MKDLHCLAKRPMSSGAASAIREGHARSLYVGLSARPSRVPAHDLLRAVDLPSSPRLTLPRFGVDAGSPKTLSAMNFSTALLSTT